MAADGPTSRVSKARYHHRTGCDSVRRPAICCTAPQMRVPDLSIALARAALACAEIKPAQLYMHSRARWIAPIGDQRREPVGEAIRSFDLGEQHHTAITGHASAVDGGGDGLENWGAPRRNRCVGATGRRYKIATARETPCPLTLTSTVGLETVEWCGREFNLRSGRPSTIGQQRSRSMRALYATS